jgi:hypothetical protein
VEQMLSTQQRSMEHKLGTFQERLDSGMKEFEAKMKQTNSHLMSYVEEVHSGAINEMTKVELNKTEQIMINQSLIKKV